MKYLWRILGVLLILCAVEGLYHPFGVATDDLLRGGMVILAGFLVVTAIYSVEIGVRSHRQVMARSRRTKPTHSYGGGYVGDGGYTPVPVVFDASCAPSVSSGVDAGSAGDGGVSC